MAAALVLTSCKSSDDDYSYSVGTKSAGSFLSAAKSSFVFTPDQEKVLTLQLGRTEYAGAETVTLTGNNPAFQVPASIDFAAGEKMKDLSIPFTLNTGKSAKLTVKITSATSVYAADSIVVTVKCDYNWVSLGEGTFSDSFIGIADAKVKILQNPANPNIYRIVGPYDQMKEDSEYDPAFPPSENMDIVIIQNGEKYNDITVNYDDLVGYERTNTGYIDADVESERVVTHPATYEKYADPATWYNSCVLAYQDKTSNGVKLPGKIQLAPVYNLPQYLTGAYGYHLVDEKNIVIILFPGYVESDYSLAYKYNGCLSDQFGTAEYALGNVTLGADVDHVKMAVATEYDYDAVVEGLSTGTLEGTTAEKSGPVKVPVTTGTNHYYMVVVAFNDKGNAVETEDFRFFFTSNKEQWTVVGTGIYTYGVESYTEAETDGESFYEGTETSTLYKSTTTDGLYTIKPWANAKANYGLTFWWDTESNVLTVDGADTGDEDIYDREGETYNDGPVTFYDLSLLGFDTYTSTYDPATKTFNFLCAYVPLEGWYGPIKETFVLDGAATARSYQFASFAKAKHFGAKKQLSAKAKRALSPKKQVKPSL
jgi:hypothetical protein